MTFNNNELNFFFLCLKSNLGKGYLTAKDVLFKLFGVLTKQQGVSTQPQCLVSLFTIACCALDFFLNRKIDMLSHFEQLPFTIITLNSSRKFSISKFNQIQEKIDNFIPDIKQNNCFEFPLILSQILSFLWIILYKQI